MVKGSYGVWCGLELTRDDDDVTDPAFYEAQAVVLSNMGQHKQALTIIVFMMHDFGKAEE